MTLALFTGALLGAMAIGMPIAFALLVCAVVLMVAGGQTDTTILSQKLVEGADSFPLLAIPFFMLAGELMNAGGISRRIVLFALTFVGHIRGGLGLVAIFASVVMAAISGSAAADAAAVTRDYRLELLGGHGGDPPLLNVWGGKLTTYRRLAEEAADRLCDVLGHPGTRWTADAPLPGGDLRDWIGAPRRPDEDLARLVQAVRERHPALGAGVARRWARQYGARVAALMAEGSAGPEVVPGVHEAELRYLHDHEWARSVDDVLWRRTKLGLHLDARQQQRLRAWWADAHGPE